MPDKSGVAEQIIALPKGGGALSGLGEKFQPNPHTGTGNFSVPIELPPGRNGFQPQLTLTYSTGNANGPFGLGWNLNIPSVSCKTSKGIPRYQGQDTFVLSGAEDLVLIKEETAPGVKRRYYRPRTEGLFARIIHTTSADINQWEVTSKDGLKSIYGKSRSSRVYDQSSDTPQRIFQWLLSETEDPFGSRIVYTYKQEDKANLAQESFEANHNYNQVFLAKIDYLDYLTAGSEEGFLFSIAFDYGEYPDQTGDLAANPSPVKPWAYRPDPFSSFRAGFEIRCLRRCRRILIKRHEQDSPPAGVLTKSYSFQYLDELSETEARKAVLPRNRVSLLAKITLTGYGNLNETESMPALEFQYTGFEPEKKHYETFAAPAAHLPERALNAPEYELIDLHGYGLPDVVHTSPSGFRYWRNLGNCRFDRPRPMHQAPARVTLADPGVRFADMEGNGTADLLVSSGPVTGYYPTRFKAQWDSASFKRYQQAPSFNLEDPDVKLVDMNGDGVIDVLQTGNSHFLIYYNKGSEGWDSQVQYVPRRDPEEFPDVYFSAPEQRVRLASLGGDGLQDIVLIHDRLIQYWPNLGYGRWGRRITMGNAPQLPPGYDPRRLFLTDIDGDGYADLVYINYGRVHCWINQSGNAWSEEYVIEGTPAVSDMDAVRVADMKGTGTAGILWTYDYSQQNPANYKYLDLTGGVKPYLLNGMDNNIGAVTRVNYASSAKFAIADQEGGIPWQTHLPFPVQVVERVELYDALSKGRLIKKYAYHHGCWDGAEREFCGFGMVEQYDTETFRDTPQPHYAPPTLSRTWFHQGPLGDKLQWGEADYSREFWPVDAQMLERPGADFPNDLPRQARRDALRALRGSVLRTELYALDNTACQDRPYTVTEYLYGVREEESLSRNDNPGLRVFFSYPLGQRTTQWERGDDPLTRCRFTNDYDDYGQPRQQTSIALPRRSAKRQPTANGRELNETRILATHTRTDYALPDPGLYIGDRIAQQRTFELVNPPQVRESDSSEISLVLKDQAAAAQALYKEFQALPDQGQAGQGLPAGIRLIAHIINHYDGDDSQAFTGRRAGVVGPYGALVRSESLVFTKDVLTASYGHDCPSYLGGSASLPEGAPADFGLSLGYRLERQSDGGCQDGYYCNTKCRKYDFQESSSGDTELPRRGIVIAAQDALGHITFITPDNYRLLPEKVTDPVGLMTLVDYDYRVLQPRELTDPNGNRTSFAYTPLGFLDSLWVKGGHDEGDQQQPSVKISYNFLAYAETRQPVNVRTLRRLYHDTEIDVPVPEREETIETVEYSDGFGRLLQTRTQDETIRFGHGVFGGGDQILPENQNDQAGTLKDIAGRTNIDALNPNVVVSDWQVYDNKGQVVEQYEPFYSTGWDYSSPRNNDCGQKITMNYDPLGRVFRTINPDTSERLAVHGIPFDLADPAHYAPSPWEIYIYDANDNAGRTPAADSQATEYEHHWNTPGSTIMDALGRTITAREWIRSRPKPGEPVKPAEQYITGFAYDIQGNLLTAIDALGRVAFKHEYDLAKRLLRVESMDAGTRLTIMDAAGNPVEQRDSKGAIQLRTYDALHRPLRLWARDKSDTPLTLRERLEYGDGSDPLQPAGERTAHRALNRLGRLYRHYEEAGLLTVDKYDFKGTILEKTRQVIKDDRILRVFAAPAPDTGIKVYRVDWEPPSGVSFDDHTLNLLDPTPYRTSLTFDALSRIKTLHFPEDVSGSAEYPSRKVLRPHYNRAGNLERVQVDDQTYVEHIAYNAKGQRTFIAYGNKLMTRYAYHPLNSRLERMRTECYAAVSPGGWEYHPTGTPLQDFAYGYDLTGNILAIRDRTPECGVGKADALDRQFIYDNLYRLISATGREQDTTPLPKPWEDGAHSTDPTLTRGYKQRYSYDPAGNMLELSHEAGTEHSFKRIFTHPEGSNRLISVKNGTNPYTCQYDPNGNLTAENTERHFGWDHSNRLTTFFCQPSGSDIASLKVQYLYDAGGQRVKKIVQKQGGDYEVTVYIDGLFEYRRLVKGNELKENNTLHVMDNLNRIAMVRIGPAFPDDGAPEIVVKYQLGDHLGSSSVVVGGKDSSVNGFINREEYYPYGETSFGSFARKRYRFTGKERDEESGLYYHGARYYAPWLGRWVSCDPLGMSDGLNLYSYVRNNPLRLIDPTGWESETAAESPPPPATHMILVGKDAAPGEEHAHRSTKSFTKRTDTLLNKQTVEMFDRRVQHGDHIIIMVPEDMSEELVTDLDSYAKKFQDRFNIADKPGITYELKKVPGNDVAETINNYSNIKSLYYFGHGIEAYPLFDYGNYGFPQPDKFDASKFSANAEAVFATCNSWLYAEKFTRELGVKAVGVEGTTFYGRTEISAGRLDYDAAPGTSLGWVYEKKGAGFTADSFSLSQSKENGKPFLRLRRDPFAPAANSH
ncbi:SpvB/TcaC N-terminal domain-containing protein [Desulfosporosinus youngiae]|uniref:RHS repeat-associated core domain protein n=1 Tax=Desulfosporosinus youngiae DSM 17734 TaxID=768710 RepID=H5XXE7_9FIRM|nr:SpvB/TcaC N-terminal domain-containing protein [Desulfosporosinus youngiae]EHQ91153.1 RHS repeat-associated core domain protein [Desulfosporosinus youngiae DSM 17734]